jgi:hypothetical protein
VGDDWLSSREVPLSSPRNSPLPHPHFHYGLAVDRVLTFVHLETEEKGQEEGELRRGEKRSSSCGEMMRSGTGKAEKSEATFLPQPRAKKKERAKNCSPSLPPRLPVPASLRPIPSRHGLAPHDVGLHDLDALLRQPRRGCTSEFFVSKSERGGKSFDTMGGDSISTRLGVADVERGSVHQPRERMSRRDCACLALSERTTAANQRRRAAPHRRRCSALFPLFDVAAHFSILSLSLYYNNSLHAQPSRGALVISASQFVSSWSLFGGNK